MIQHAKIIEEGFDYPIITPLKVLKGHKNTKQGLSVFDCQFFNYKYWIASAGSYGEVKIWA